MARHSSIRVTFRAPIQEDETMVMVNVLWNSNLGAYHADLTINDDCEVYVDGDAMAVVVTAQRTE